MLPCYNQKQSSDGFLQKRCSYKFRKIHKKTPQFVIFKPLRHCFEETKGFGVKASFASRPMSRLIR